MPVRSISKNTFLILSFIIPILLLSSCSESPKKEKIEIKFDSLIYDKNGNLFTGTKKGTVNGKTVEYDVFKGVKHGSFKIYGGNGNIEIEGQIKENKNDGLWKYYYPNGTLESEGNFVNDMVEGKWNWYYSSGKLKETAEYKNGLRNGKLIIYDEEGNIVSEKFFEKGTEVKND
ncbi:MAG: hypothetical protein A2V93_12210 [Ignavibacteria bacterium RBG_16_34_14]|nr:MAG: hypothetical protein A2V93_12210 [Ignavibacteria bacterium RBG_16_34_14]